MTCRVDSASAIICVAMFEATVETGVFYLKIRAGLYRRANKRDVAARTTTYVRAFSKESHDQSFYHHYKLFDVPSGISQ